MATSIGKRRPFPALVIVPLLFAFCLYPGQTWLAHLFPGLAGLASIDPGLVILGSPSRLLIPIDLILLPALFVFLYILFILIYAVSQHQPIGQNILRRVTALLSGVFFLIACTAIGALISYILVDNLPGDIRRELSAIGITADIRLGYAPNILKGNILPLIGFLVGVVVLLYKITRNPFARRTLPLTRQQRITPYQRFLDERRRPISPSSPTPQTPTPSFLQTQCLNQPLRTLEPERVNYRPLG